MGKKSRERMTGKTKQERTVKPKGNKDIRQPILTFKAKETHKHMLVPAFSPNIEIIG